MRVVTCPFCHEKGRIPETFIGKRIKCGKCDNRFLVTAPPPKGTPAAAAAAAPAAAGAAAANAPAPASPRGDHEIEIEGMDDVSWQTLNASASAPVVEAQHGHDPEAQGVFTAAPPSGDLKEYRLLTQKDKWFEGKFDLPRLEEAINFYAHQGWKVKAMTTAQVKGFSGGVQEELVILLER